MGDHERMPVYARALDAAVAMELIARNLDAHRPDLADQIRRSSAAIPLNIAEGAGEFRPAEKARFYRMARRSAAECSAVLDLAERLGPPPPAASALRTQLREIDRMLTALVRRVDIKRQ